MLNRLNGFEQVVFFYFSLQIPYISKTGPIAPMLHHRSPDGRAFVSARQIPGGGVMCYMAVSPDGFDDVKI